MSDNSEVQVAKGEEEEDGTTLTPTNSVTKFQATLAKYRFSTELPVPRRSNQDSSLLLEEEELAANTSRSNTLESPRGKKRRNSDTELSPKKKKPKRGYAEPERYAHLNELPDIIASELDVLFCGINPGEYSATVGHHFANPTNHFWRCLRDSGLTGRELVPPSDDHTLPKLFSLGLTNLVHRPTAEQNELADVEFKAGVPALMLKIAKYRPYVVCFVGLGIAKTRGAGDKETTSVRFQSFKFIHTQDPTSAVQETLFFAMPSTSGRVVQFQRKDKVEIMKELRAKLIDIKSGQFNTSSMHQVRA